MELPGGGASGPGLSSGSVPAFLTKLWTLVEDPDTDPLIRWSPSGSSFHVFDQARFSKEVLPKFFKHNNMASFVRQLNMYGFRKVLHMDQSGLVQPERDDTEFQHTFFIRGKENLLENIKRKVTNVSAVRQEEVKFPPEEVKKILGDVQMMKGKQENIDVRLSAMKQENETLWREVALLRQKHTQQQKVVNKLLQFLVSLVQTNRILGVKRKIPLMLNDSNSAHSMPKYSRPLSLEHIQAAASLFSADSPPSSGPIISDITEVTTPPAADPVTDWTNTDQLVDIKEEPSSPESEACPVLEGVASPVDTPFSPTTFINSILQEDTPPDGCSSDAATPTGMRSPAHSETLQSASGPGVTHQNCQTIACIARTELTHHVDQIDNSLEHLQSALNTPQFTFDASPLMEFFSSSLPSSDLDLDSLDSLLYEEAPKGDETGKQLVQYTPVGVEGVADLLGMEPLFMCDSPSDGSAALGDPRDL